MYLIDLIIIIVMVCATAYITFILYSLRSPFTFLFLILGGLIILSYVLGLYSDALSLYDWEI